MILFNTADICDENNNIQIGDPIFKSYGKNQKFCGMIRTVTAIEDNSYVKKLVEEKVDGDVMVVEGKASTKCALLGDNLAMKAFKMDGLDLSLMGVLEIQKLSIIFQLG